MSFLFLFGCNGSAEAPMAIPGALTDTPGAKSEASNISFWPQAVPAHLSYFGALAPDSPTLLQLTSGPTPADTSSPTPFQSYQPPVPGSPADDKDLSCLANISSACVMKAVAMAEHTGPPKATGEGEWPGSRKGIGTRRGSLLNFAKNLSFLSLSLLLLLGLLYL